MEPWGTLPLISQSSEDFATRTTPRIPGITEK